MAGSDENDLPMPAAWNEVGGPLHIGDATESFAGMCDSVKAVCDAIMSGGIVVKNHLMTPWGAIDLQTVIGIPGKV